MRTGALLALVLSLTSGCWRNTKYVCARDVQCVFQGTSGRCEPSGYCSFPDTTCATGYRYAFYAEASLGSMCTGSGHGDGGSGDGGAPSCKPVELALGADHSCARTETGEVYCWGSDSAGQIGDGNLGDGDAKRPVAVVGVDSAARLSGATQLSAGGANSCALLPDFSVVCWGTSVGLGDGSTAPRARPGPVSGITTAREVRVGATHACARLEDATARCWGVGGDGELGNGSTTSTPMPMPVLSAAGGMVATGLSGLALGNRHSCALQTSGNVACWGSCVLDQTGNLFECDAGGAPYKQLSMVGVYAIINSNATSLADVVWLAAGDYHNVALRRNGEVVAWGDNASGELGRAGNGSETAYYQPIAGAQGFDGSVAAGFAHSCARRGGKAWCWGAGTRGQIGGADTANHDAQTPVLTSPTGESFDGIVSLAAGGDHTCAIRSDDSIWCWGDNAHGQLGDDSTMMRPNPVQVLLSCP